MPLKNPSPPVRKAALIALDQMGGRPLQLEHLLSILQDEGAARRHAALWVSSHHPEWSGRLFGSLSRRLQTWQLSSAEVEAIGDLLVSLCHDVTVQDWIGKSAGDARTGAARKVFLLDTMDRCSVKVFPKVWIAALGEALFDENTQIRARAVALVGARRLSALAPELERLARRCCRRR